MSDRDALLDAGRDIAVDRQERGFVVSGARLVAQDVREEIHIPRGSLFWDRDAGSDVLAWLNAEDVPPGQIIAELERVALDDDRIDARSVRAEQLPGAARYRLSFAVIGGAGREEVVMEGAE